jgi:GntR family transcriptional regulator
MAQVPRYQQIADDLRRRIESREFTTDVPLPTEADLQNQYEASRNTVREAVKLLAQQHLLETRAGQGTFVTKAIVPFVTTLSTDPKIGVSGGGEGATYPALIREQGREADAGIPNVTVLTCPPQVAAWLGIEADAEVVSRHQRRYSDGTIWSVQTSYYPMRWVERGAVGLLKPKDIPEGAVQYIAEVLSLKQVGYRDLISARLPDDEEQSLFNLTHNHTVIEVCRTSFAEDATPIRVTVTVFPSDRNQIAYDVGGVPEHFEEPLQPSKLSRS